MVCIDHSFMGIIQRQGIQSAVFTYLGIALGYINMVWLFPMHLESSQFGLTRLIIALSFVVSEFGRLGTASMVVRYFPAFKDTGTKHNGILTLLLGICTIGSIGLLLALWIGKPFLLQMYNIQDATLLSGNYGWFLVITLFFVFSETLFAYSQSLLRNVVPVFVKETLLRLLQTAAIIGFAIDAYDFHVFMGLFAFTFGIQNIVMLLYLGWLKELPITWRTKIPAGISIKELWSYGFFMMLNRFPNTALMHVDVIMVSALIDLSTSGIYAIAVFIAAIVRVPGRLINQISGPLVARHFQEGDMESIQKLYRQSAVSQFIIGAGITILLLVNYHTIDQYLQEGYRDMFFLLLWLCIGNILDMMTGINGVIITNSRYYRFDLNANFFLVLLTIGTNFLLIPQLGSIGAAVATAIALGTYNLLKLVFVQIRFNMLPFSNKMWQATIVLGISFLVGWIFPTINDFPIVDLLIRSLLTTGVLFGLVLWWKVSPELTEVVTKALDRQK